MPPVLLFRDTFEGATGTIDLKDHTPTPGGVGTWIYEGADNRFRRRVVVGEGDYADAAIDTSASVARLYLMPPGPLRFRVGGSWFRENVDFVGGFFEFYCYIPDEAPGVWDFKDCLKLTGQRHSLGEISLSADWIKPAGFPAPPVQNVAFAGSQLLVGNDIRDFWIEVDETTSLVRIVSAPLDTTPGDPAESVLSEGTLPPELLAHVAADRITGWSTTRAASGLVAFRLYGFAAWDMGVPVVITGPPCTLLLRVYGDNRTTVLWEVASDPAHEFPYLVEPQDYGAQELDFAAGAASVGTVRVQVVDKAQIAGDQDSGFVTGKLAALGIPAIGGHRCELIRFDPDGNPVVIMDGPATQPVMAEYSAFEWEIQDTRETERKVRCFDVVGPTAPVVDDAAATGPAVPGSGFGFTWGTEYP